MATALVSAPEQGWLVVVRSRRWVVDEVQASALAPPPLDPSSTKPKHLISRLSAEDDALDDELEVSIKSTMPSSNWSMALSLQRCNDWRES